jgi:hypothetical protein
MVQEAALPEPLNVTRPDLLNIDVIKCIAVKIARTADPENLHANQTSADLIRGLLAPTHSVLCELHPLARPALHRDRFAEREPSSNREQLYHNSLMPPVALLQVRNGSRTQTDSLSTSMHYWNSSLQQVAWVMMSCGLPKLFMH